MPRLTESWSCVPSPSAARLEVICTLFIEFRIVWIGIIKLIQQLDDTGPWPPSQALECQSTFASPGRSSSGPSSAAAAQQWRTGPQCRPGCYTRRSGSRPTMTSRLVDWMSEASLSNGNHPGRLDFGGRACSSRLPPRDQMRMLEILEQLDDAAD